MQEAIVLKSRIFMLIPLLLVMAAIFIFSAQNSEASSNLSDGIADKFFAEQITENHFSIIRFIRKSAHFIIYSVLGLFSMFYLKGGYKLSYKMSIIISAVFCFLYAASDEIHQLFVEGRSGQFSDVLLDTMGSLTGILIFCGVAYAYNRLKNKKEDTN